MQQLTQRLSNGEIIVQDVPSPTLGRNMILVKNFFSVISSGTESNTVKTARKSLLGKAKERPQQVKQVLEVLKQQGPIQTYRAVTKKLEAYSPLGYSSAGIVIAVGQDVKEFSIGDKVACAGVGYANHAEINAVPTNLSVKLESDANLKTASYNTLGAIALQGIRQADLRLGESCAVIGLGLLGQLACVLLRASGIKVIGIDINESSVQIAEKYSTDLAFVRDHPGIEKRIIEYTDGIGCDAVIIAAGTNSYDPINFAGSITRKKGKIIILGAVPTGFDREPNWYRKELELKMSCSYGPGRYDPTYEEKGIDYPVGYVRWTEKRNMKAFQDLLLKNNINIDFLTTHQFNFIDSPKAYDIIVNKSEPFLGIVLAYDTDKEEILNNKIQINDYKKTSNVSVGFIGAGSYAQGNLIPNIPKKNGNVLLRGVMTNSGTTSKRVAERFGFEFCTSNEADILNNVDINTVFIATRHDSHAEFVCKSLSSNLNVFVEKPLCLNIDELERIIELKNKFKCQLLVGYNRRFSSLSIKLKELIGSGPMTILYRINAGLIPEDNWIQDLQYGGGRIIGEVCHFIDFMTWLNGSIPVSVYATAIPDSFHLNDTLNINIHFANGSSGVVAYYANGPKMMPKEYIEVFYSGLSGIIDNFKRLTVYNKKKYTKKLFNQDKGQTQMISSFMESLNAGKDLIPFEETVAVSKASFAVLESLRTKLPVEII